MHLVAVCPRSLLRCSLASTWWLWSWPLQSALLWPCGALLLASYDFSFAFDHSGHCIVGWLPLWSMIASGRWVLHLIYLVHYFNILAFYPLLAKEPFGLAFRGIGYWIHFCATTFCGDSPFGITQTATRSQVRVLGIRYLKFFWVCLLIWGVSLTDHCSTRGEGSVITMDDRRADSSAKIHGVEHLTVLGPRSYA